jgi:phospholipase/carboxylesterase
MAMAARTWAPGLAAAVALAAASAWAGPVRSQEPARLATIDEGPAWAPTLVLLHGYRSSAAEWVQFEPALGVGSVCRFVFPQGPALVAGHAGEAHGHAWWRMALASYVPPGRTLPDLSRARPSGLVKAAEAVERLTSELRSTAPPRAALVLGGFSQGAMVAGQVAFTSDAPLAAVVLLSVTPVDEVTWRRGFARRRGTPIFMAHGRADRSLSFTAARRLRDEMRAAGLDVTWFPFEGGHEIPSVVIEAMNRFLAAKGVLPARPTTTARGRTQGLATAAR